MWQIYIIKLYTQKFLAEIRRVCIDFGRCRVCPKKSKTGSVKRQQEGWPFPRCIRGVNHKDRFYGPGATVRHGDIRDVGRRPRKSKPQACNLTRIVTSRRLEKIRWWLEKSKKLLTSARRWRCIHNTRGHSFPPSRDLRGKKQNPLPVEKVSENSSIGISKARTTRVLKRRKRKYAKLRLYNRYHLYHSIISVF